MKTIYGQPGKGPQLNWNVAVTDFIINPDNHGTSSATPSRPTSGKLQDCTHPPLTSVMQVCSTANSSTSHWLARTLLIYRSGAMLLPHCRPWTWRSSWTSLRR